MKRYQELLEEYLKEKGYEYRELDYDDAERMRASYLDTCSDDRSLCAEVIEVTFKGDNYKALPIRFSFYKDSDGCAYVTLLCQEVAEIPQVKALQGAVATSAMNMMSTWIRYFEISDDYGDFETKDTISVWAGFESYITEESVGEVCLRLGERMASTIDRNYFMLQEVLNEPLEM